MNKFLWRGILALGALSTLSVAGTSARAGTFSFAGINTAVTGIVNITQIPEPVTMVLLGMSLVGMAGAVRKRRNVPKS